MAHGPQFTMSFFSPPRPAASLKGKESFARSGLAAAAAVSLALLGAVALPQTASADPADISASSVFTTPGPFAGTVPAGTCYVQPVVLGASGGSAVSTTSNVNGAGAQVSARFAVLPGQAFAGTVGGGGGEPSGSSPASSSGPGGFNGGGAGGTSGTAAGVRHHGAGGGGYSELLFNGELAILAGGGGGSGGGHSESTDGMGGNAGLPAGPGVTAGGAGTQGLDTPAALVTGGEGGSTTPGAGGVNSNDPAVNGFPGSGTTGGAGGDDPNPDAGGGGGGGYMGGGGGASTIGYNTLNGSSEIAGAGGGGGSSFVAAATTYANGTTPITNIASVPGLKLSQAGTGAGGTVVLEWIPCNYDLAVSKSVSGQTATIGSTVDWTIAVTNEGPDAMTSGDTVTLTDTLPGAGTKTITGISVSGGSNAVLARDSLTCDAAVGEPMPASLDCSRPFQIIGSTASGVRGLDAGETLTVTYRQAITDAFGTELVNTATVVDRHLNENDTSTATTRVVADPPNAVNDEDLNNAIGETVPVSVLTNDTGTIVPASLTFFDPTTNTPVSGPLEVPGEGTWTIGAGQIIFTPEEGFEGDPTPVTYRITDTNGQTDTATVTVTYVPTAANDEDLNNTIGQSVPVSVLTNDIGDFDTSTVRILDGATPVTSLVVAGQGTWTVEADGVIRFTPAEGFKGDPTPITYQVDDTTGDTVTATVTVTYLPVAVNDSSTGNQEGSPVTVDVIGNDTGTFDPASVRLIDPITGELITTLVVAGEGTWTVNPATGAITFTPESGFKGDPTPVRYQVTDLDGDVTTAEVSIAYVHPAALTPIASTPAAPLASSGSLANTGTNAFSVIGFAALAFLLGGAGIFAARRHRIQE